MELPATFDWSEPYAFGDHFSGALLIAFTILLIVVDVVVKRFADPQPVHRQRADECSLLIDGCPGQLINLWPLRCLHADHRPTGCSVAAQSELPEQPVGNGDPAYPTVCIPPAPPDVDWADIPNRLLTVLPPDPHRFDGSDANGIGCEKTRTAGRWGRAGF